jgi:sugar O-acyltransferase (sialic acid O-acetyltransferase NeuD family)
VVGAGGFGREVVDVVEASNAAGQGPPWDLLGVVDDAISALNRERLVARSISYLGTTDEFLDTVEPPVAYVVGIGSPSVRRKMADRLDAAGLVGATVVHPSVTIGAGVTLGVGVVLCAGVRITTNIRIGRHVHINLNATVGHDSEIADFVSINPLASISGDCVLEREVLVGVGGIVLNGLRVGEGATVGGAACVVRDVPPHSTVVGIPARQLTPRQV